MNYKYFGIAALIGLAAVWLFDRPVHARGPRTLIASWEREADRGKRMANGELHNPDRFTAASWDFPLGTFLKVTSPVKPGVTIVVEVCDRGPNKRLLKTRQLDLSKSAFEALAPLRRGLISVMVEKL